MGWLLISESSHLVVCLFLGEIPWSDTLYVQSKSATAFDVVTVCPSVPFHGLYAGEPVSHLHHISVDVALAVKPHRVYHLNDLVNGSKKWIEAINAALVRSMKLLSYVVWRSGGSCDLVLSTLFMFTGAAQRAITLRELVSLSVQMHSKRVSIPYNQVQQTTYSLVNKFGEHHQTTIHACAYPFSLRAPPH